MERRLVVSVYDAVVDGTPCSQVNDNTVLDGYGAFFTGIQIGTEEVAYLPTSGKRLFLS